MIYEEFVNYISKMKICRRISSFLDDQDKFDLYHIRIQLVLDVRKKEAEFCEGKLMGLAQEMIKRFDNQKERIKAKYAKFKQWCIQNTEDKIQVMASEVNKKMKDKLVLIQNKFEEQNKMICKIKRECNKKIQNFEDKLIQENRSIYDFISKQGKFNLEQTKLNKEAENKLKEQGNQILNV